MRSLVQGARILESILHNNAFSWGSHIANATLTMTIKHPTFMEVDPVGTDGRKVLLPAVAAANRGKFFIIANSADAAESIVVKDSTDTTTYATVAQNEMVIMVQGGAVWFPLVGPNT